MLADICLQTDASGVYRDSHSTMTDGASWKRLTFSLVKPPYQYQNADCALSVLWNMCSLNIAVNCQLLLRIIFFFFSPQTSQLTSSWPVSVSAWLVLFVASTQKTLYFTTTCLSPFVSFLDDSPLSSLQLKGSTCRGRNGTMLTKGNRPVWADSSSTLQFCIPHETAADMKYGL